MFELWLVKETYKVNLLPVVTSLSWSASVDSLGVQLDFEINQDMYMQLNTNYTIDVGDTLALLWVKDGKCIQLWRGILVTQNKSKDFIRSYTCFDYAFYLNKSKEVIQFNNIPINQAIAKLLDKYNIKHNICSISNTIKKIYSDKNVSDIIKDMLQYATSKNGKKYNMYMKADTLYIEEWKTINIDATEMVLLELNSQRSMENMSNQIVIHNSSEKTTSVYATAKDDKSIKKYGLIQTVQSIDEKEKSKAQSVANTVLKELNRITETGSVTMQGNIEFKCGNIIHIFDKQYKVDTKYVIKSINHSISNNEHTMSLDLEVWNG